MTAGQRLRHARESAGLSQTQLANLLGVTQGAVYQWEKDATKPKSRSLGKLATVLGVDLNDLAAWCDEMLPEQRVGEKRSRYGDILSRLPADQRELLALYTRLSKTRQRALLDFLRKY